ncbi:hypothetical protein A2U01_0074360, partial [Trifolium medium]|nr:hypothetical protein [Trifolium medium]
SGEGLDSMLAKRYNYYMEGARG